jgi:hypothetical protein
MQLLVALVLAQPFVRTMAASHEGAACLWWPTAAIEFRQAAQGNPATGVTASLGAVSTAFLTWNDAMKCSTLQLNEGPKVASRKVGATQAGPNVNLVLFRSRSCARAIPATHACWADGSCSNAFDCWDQSSALLATTTVTFDSVTGAVFDADIEFNAVNHVFTVVDAPVCTDGAVSQRCVATDIQNTATHEIGHFLGLGHTTAHGSTMNERSTMGERSKRSLDQGTRAFLCQSYSPETGPDDCVLPPVGELVGPAPKGCSAAPSLGPLLLAAALLFRRRSVAVVAGLVAVTSLASTVEALSPAELASRSDRVAHVRVASVHARWAGDGMRIVTEVEFEVLRTWRGPSSARLTAMVPGGVVGRIGQRVAGAPAFHEGDEVVVFLEARGDRFVLTALGEGVFPIVRTAEGQVVTRPASSIRAVDAESGREGSQVMPPLPLEAFRQLVTAPRTQGADSNRALPAALPTQISR